MTTEPNDSIQQSLIDMRAAMLERQAMRALKKLKTGRMVTLVAILFFSIPFFPDRGAFFYAGWPAIWQGVIVLSFATLFVVSRYRPFISLVVISVLFTVLAIWWFIHAIIYKPDVLLFTLTSSMLPVVIFMASLLRIIAIYYFIMAALHARKYERLTVELDSLETP